MLWVVADRLAQPAGAWRPFAPPSRFGLGALFPREERDRREPTHCRFTRSGGLISISPGTDASQRRSSPWPRRVTAHEGGQMIILGLILLVLGFVFSIPVLWTIGVILLVVGAVLALLGATGRAVGGRRFYW